MRKVSMAFEATQDSVWVVFRNAGIEKTLDRSEEITENLDLAEIDHAALHRTEQQTDSAHAEIREQPIQFGHLSRSPGYSPIAG